MNASHPKRPMPGLGVPYSFASQAVLLPCHLHRIPLDPQARPQLTQALCDDLPRAFPELAFECLGLRSKELAHWAALWGELASELGRRWVEEGGLTVVAPPAGSSVLHRGDPVPSNPLVTPRSEPAWTEHWSYWKLEPELRAYGLDFEDMDGSSIERAADAFARLWACDDGEIVRFVERFGSPFFPFGPVLDPVDLIRRESHKFACFRRLRRVLASCEGSIPSDREVESAMRDLWLRHDSPSVPPRVRYEPTEWILTHFPPPAEPSRLSTCKPSYFAGLDAEMRAVVALQNGLPPHLEHLKHHVADVPSLLRRLGRDREDLVNRAAEVDPSLADAYAVQWCFEEQCVDLGFEPVLLNFMEAGRGQWPSPEGTTAGQIRVWMFEHRLPRSPGACAVEAVRLTLDRVARLLWTVRSDESALRVRVVSHCLLGSLYLHETMAAAVVPKPCPYFDRCGRYLSSDGTIFGQPKRRDAKTCGEPACQRRMQRETARLRKIRPEG